MTQKKRNILFVIVTLFFFIFAPVVVFYSQGYRFDFNNFEIVKTGAFYFRVVPREAKISISFQDQLIVEKETSFFFGTLYLENLIPREYKVIVSKDGYHSWEKNLDINPKKVTEANNITLLPKEIELKTIDGALELFNKEEEVIEEVIEEVDEDFLAYGVNNNNEIVFLTKDGLIKKGGEVMRMKPFEIKEGADYKIYFLNTIVIRENDDFYFLNKDLEYKLVFSSPNDPVLSPDNSKIAYFNDSEIKILFLNNFKQSFLTRVSKKIQDVYWLNSDYLIFSVPGEIKSIEIDNRDKANIVDLEYIDHDSIYFNQKNKKLYVLVGDEVMESKKLLP